MNHKIVVFSSLAWALAAIFSPRSANALAGVPALEEPSQVIQLAVSRQYISEFSTVYCEVGTREFSFQQLMTVPGEGAVWVATEMVYSPGRKEATLYEVCEDESGEEVYIYGLDSCAC